VKLDVPRRQTPRDRPAGLLLAGGAALQAIGLAVLVATSASLADVVLAVVLISFGDMLYGPNLSAMVSRIVPPRPRGHLPGGRRPVSRHAACDRSAPLAPRGPAASCAGSPPSSLRRRGSRHGPGRCGRRDLGQAGGVTARRRRRGDPRDVLGTQRLKPQQFVFEHRRLQGHRATPYRST
jgi:hypothetical protein